MTRHVLLSVGDDDGLSLIVESLKLQRPELTTLAGVTPDELAIHLLAQRPRPGLRVEARLIAEAYHLDSGGRINRVSSAAKLWNSNGFYTSFAQAYGTAPNIMNIRRKHRRYLVVEATDENVNLLSEAIAVTTSEKPTQFNSNEELAKYYASEPIPVPLDLKVGRMQRMLEVQEHTADSVAKHAAITLRILSDKYPRQFSSRVKKFCRVYDLERGWVRAELSIHTSSKLSARKLIEDLEDTFNDVLENPRAINGTIVSSYGHSPT